MKPTYEVTFFKRIADSTGHCTDAEQGRVSVSIDRHPTASVVEAASECFARACGVPDWRQRADYARIAVQHAGAQSRPAES